MTNPFSAPKSNLVENKPTTHAPKGGTLRWIASSASALAIVICLIIAGILIPQALKLASDSSGLPQRLQSNSLAEARASWIGGLAAAGCVLANCIGLVLIRARQAALPLTIFAVSVAVMIAVAILFKPA